VIRAFAVAVLLLQVAEPFPFRLAKPVLQRRHLVIVLDILEMSKDVSLQVRQLVLQRLVTDKGAPATLKFAAVTHEPSST
jgi:hypothetical protein